MIYRSTGLSHGVFDCSEEFPPLYYQRCLITFVIVEAIILLYIIYLHLCEENPSLVSRHYTFVYTSTVKV